METWIGLMSGTSMDSVDAVLVSFDNKTIHIHDTLSTPYPDSLRQRLALASQNQATPDEVGELDTLTGLVFAEAAENLIRNTTVDRSSIHAIGSHGQTLRHQPSGPGRFSLQIGNPAIIAERTQVTTVADFRSRDMAAGGQGAPLVPAFHKHFFSSETEDRCILNLGGIANITWIPACNREPVTGFDTGPANALLDAWCLDQTGRPYDEGGRWAEEGTVDQGLLGDMLSDAYFSRPAPKSTGKEKFNLEWVKTQVHRHPGIRPEDVQRTLLKLTVITAARQMPQSPSMSVYVCGGGAQNPLLMKELALAISPARVLNTETLGLSAQWVEPVAFAWLARQTLKRKPGNLADVTGAKGPRILGAIYPA
ncbi:anhydro-N-acetylmuramic acid kinase [Marinobacter adhaerens]|uniref:Anhydro-N-acetylmuramic acid kinase n=1 Tax=Marinobacter adhaerens TaxID=1033846 RepID=A0A851HV61_9GAMM|nr:MULTISPECIES: anhydro-N-acetylmuramic acid kinase [Marinobacter]NWN92927.1 anhydro-N-acetylmuramic acid kinase [Marinobacter adhaerens]